MAELSLKQIEDKLNTEFVGDLRKLVILHRSIGNGIHSDDFTKPDSDGDDNENRHKSARRQISARSCARVLCFFF